MHFSESDPENLSVLKNHIVPFLVAKFGINKGKTESGEDDQIIQVNRTAAEEVIRVIRTHPSFEGQVWGYLIAYESDAGLWVDLLAGLNLVSTQG